MAWLLLAFGFCQAAAAREVVFLTLEYPPYSSESIRGNGAMIEVLQQALDGTDWKLKIKFVPWLRAAYEVRSGGADGAVLLWPEETVSFSVIATKPVFISKLGFFVPIEHWDSADVSLSALRGKRVCTVRGYGYPPELMGAGIVRDDADSDDANLKRVSYGRCDFVAVERAVGHFLLSKSKPGNALVKWKEPAFASIPLLIGVRANLPDAAKLLADIEKGIARMKKSGRFRSIVEAYSLDAPKLENAAGFSTSTKEKRQKSSGGTN